MESAESPSEGSDPKSAKPVTMQMVADRAGLSRSAVSYALRGHPSIPPETRMRVETIAREMGYQRNAYISALMAQIHRKRISSEHPSIAWIVHERLDPHWVHGDYYGRVLHSAVEHAQALGYTIEVFTWGSAGMTEQRLGQILKARGIRGLVAAPVPEGERHLGRFPFHHFACCTIGYTLKEPQLHRVGIDYSQGMRLLWTRVRARGHQRIGLILSSAYDERTDYLNRGVCLALQSMGREEDMVPPLLLDTDDPRFGDFRVWFRDHRPDAIITTFPETIRRLLEENGEVRGPIIFMINHDRVAPLAGILQPDDEIGATAIDLVINQIHRGAHGPPSSPNTTLLPYKWMEAPVSAGS
jgi:DNA-binding LacI/PurR family transcriptional regulator